jgi:hypothetical protein
VARDKQSQKQKITYVKTGYTNAFVTVKFPGYPTEILCSSTFHPLEKGDFMPGPDDRIWQVWAKGHRRIIMGSRTLRIAPIYYMVRMSLDFDPERAAGALCHE